MSDNNYFNRSQRQLFSALGGGQEVNFSDVFLEKAVLNSLTVAAQNPAINVQVLYPESANNGYYSIDSAGTLTITKKGLYCVAFEASFSPFIGDCTQFIQVNINNIDYGFGLNTSQNTNRALALGTNSVLSNSITIALKENDQIKHFVAAHIVNASPNFTLYGANTTNRYTNLRLVYLSQP